MKLVQTLCFEIGVDVTLRHVLGFAERREGDGEARLWPNEAPGGEAPLATGGGEAEEDCDRAHPRR
eukprot:4315636-Heterocapsa_arctica.AAC.1